MAVGGAEDIVHGRVVRLHRAEANLEGRHLLVLTLFFFKQKTAYAMVMSDWSSDVCSSDLATTPPPGEPSGPNRSLSDAGPGSSGRSIRTTSDGRRCGPRATIAGRREPRSPPETESIP